ncbi:uncharacterized protein [Panulirus ornatus]|uniref:uncharacterized protein isoform X2 n=1 Tax=Panulirus ornatus TaxID=150431 RepID=UPI003A8BB9EC
MSDFDQFSSIPQAGHNDPTPDPDRHSSGSNRDSLNLDDFEKVEADQLPPSVNQSARMTSDLLDDIMSHVSSSGPDPFSNFSSGPTSDTKPGISSASSDPSLSSDPFKRDEDRNDPFSTDNLLGDTYVTGSVSAPADSFGSGLSDLASTPPASNDLQDKISRDMSQIDDFLAGGSHRSNVNDAVISQANAQKPANEPLFEPFSATESQAPPAMESLLDPMPAPVTQAPAALRDPSPEPFFKREPTPPRQSSPPLREPSPPSLREPTPPRQPSPIPREPTPPRQPSPKPREPTPPRQPSPKPREPTPPRQPSPIPREPTPPRHPSPPPREPTPPRKPSPPPREPTPPRKPSPPPREPTPPRQPTPPPREPTPPRQPTPPPRKPTPPPREPTPPRKPTPPPREPTPPRKTSPPTVQVQKAAAAAPVQEARVTPGKTYKVSDATRASFAVFNPLVELIYWRDVKRTGAVFAGLLVLLISMAFLSLISVVSYASLTILTGTITYRVYKNIMQAVQKSQDGHPFKTFLELDTDLPADKVHEASEVVMNQINLTITELKRLFFVEDLVDSIKFGCLLWCLTYLGSWFNGLTLVILATVAVFTLPKVYEQNKAHIDQYWTLVRTQVNDVMTKVKAAIPIGNKEKTQ